MPKVRAFTPAWLSSEFPDGHDLFSPAAAPKAASFSASTANPRSSVYGSKNAPPATPGPRKTVARRGTEVFIANGKEIRWADLVTMKSAWEAKNEAGASFGTAPAQPVYRILKPPVADDIRQLVMSPHANYMAILTTHTVHICILPDPSHLLASGSTDTPLKTRFFTLGPTTHVTTRSPVVSALWHPLGVNGSALVTVTRDAVVRLWEVSPLDRWSFDVASLAIDIKKLADGTSLDQDFGASVNTNTSYSPDLFDMEVAAASFGPRSSGGWSSMTLWLAMVGGDIYALCPLLPKRWAPPPTLIPSLSVAIVSNVAAIEDDPNVSAREKQLARQQLEWMSQLDNQEPTFVDPPASAGYEPPSEIYVRPSQPSIVPRLQGPFELDLEDDEDSDKAGELCDIFIIGEKVDPAFLMGSEDDGDELAYRALLDDADQEGLSLPIICLITTTGKLRVCLDLVGVEAQWLPQRNKSSLVNGRNSVLSTDYSTSRPLLTFQVIDLVRDAEQRPDGWATISPDVTSRYSFFVTHSGGITNISLSSWVFRLEQELQESADTGADFRLKQLVTGENTVRQRVYTHSRDEALAASIVMRDPDLGYFLLSATDHSPVAINFELPEGEDLGASTFRSTFRSTARSTPEEEAEDKAVLALDFWKARPAFEIPPGLLVHSELSQAKSMLFSSRYQMLQHQQVKLSPATLDIFTNTHKLVGKETGRLVQGVAEVFTKLEDLPAELYEQVESTNELKGRIDMIAGNDVDDEAGEKNTDDARLRKRLQAAEARQKDLADRMEKLRRTFHRASARPLSDKERAWSQEVRALEASLDKIQPGATAAPSTAAAAPASGKDTGLRVKQVRGLWEDLSAEAEVLLQKEKAHAAVGDTASTGSRGSTPPSTSAGPQSVKVPSEVRKAKMAQVTKLLERETAMVEAVTERLERLGVA